MTTYSPAGRNAGWAISQQFILALISVFCFCAPTATASVRVAIFCSSCASVADIQQTQFWKVQYDAIEQVMKSHPGSDLQIKFVPERDLSQQELDDLIVDIRRRNLNLLLMTLYSADAPQQMVYVAQQVAPMPIYAIDTIPPSADEIPDNVKFTLFKEDHGGFIAGVLAGLTTQTQNVGIIAGLSFVPLKLFRAGFQSGVRQVCPQCIVQGVYGSSFISPEQGEELAQRQLAEGADVIFGAAGGTGTGAILYAANRSKLVIGVDSDEYFTTFSGRPERAYLIGSAIKRIDIAASSAVESVIDGSFTPGVSNLGIPTGISLAPCHDACSFVSDTVQNVIDGTQAGIKDGQIQLNILGTGSYDISDIPLATAQPMNDHYGISRPLSPQPDAVAPYKAVHVPEERILVVTPSVSWSTILVLNTESYSVDRIPLRVASGSSTPLLDLTDFGFTELGGVAYITGGLGRATAGGQFQASANIFKIALSCPSYCSDYATIERTGALPTTLTQHAVVAVERRGTLLTIGGSSGVAGQVIDTVTEIYPNGTVAGSRAPQPQARRAQGAVWWRSAPGFRGYATAQEWAIVYGGSLIVTTDDLSFYNIGEDRWYAFAVSSIASPPPMLNAGLLVFGPNLYLFGDGDRLWHMLPAEMRWHQMEVTVPNRSVAVKSFGDDQSETFRKAGPVLSEAGTAPVSAPREQVVLFSATATSTLNFSRMVMASFSCAVGTPGLRVAHAGTGCMSCGSSERSVGGLYCETVPADSDGLPDVTLIIGLIIGVMFFLVIAFFLFKVVRTRKQTFSQLRALTTGVGIVFQAVDIATDILSCYIVLAREASVAFQAVYTALTVIAFFANLNEIFRSCRFFYLLMDGDMSTQEEAEEKRSLGKAALVTLIAEDLPMIVLACTAMVQEFDIVLMISLMASCLLLGAKMGTFQSLMEQYRRRLREKDGEVLDASLRAASVSAFGRTEKSGAFSEDRRNSEEVMLAAVRLARAGALSNARRVKVIRDLARDLTMEVQESGVTMVEIETLLVPMTYAYMSGVDDRLINQAITKGSAASLAINPLGSNGSKADEILEVLPISAGGSVNDSEGTIKAQLETTDVNEMSGLGSHTSPQTPQPDAKTT